MDAAHAPWTAQSILVGFRNALIYACPQSETCLPAAEGLQHGRRCNVDDGSFGARDTKTQTQTTRRGSVTDRHSMRMTRFHCDFFPRALLRPMPISRKFWKPAVVCNLWCDARRRCRAKHRAAHRETLGRCRLHRCLLYCTASAGLFVSGQQSDCPQASGLLMSSTRTSTVLSTVHNNLAQDSLARV